MKSTNQEIIDDIENRKMAELIERRTGVPATEHMVRFARNMSFFAEFCEISEKEAKILENNFTL